MHAGVQKDRGKESATVHGFELRKKAGRGEGREVVNGISGTLDISMLSRAADELTN